MHNHNTLRYRSFMRLVFPILLCAVMVFSAALPAQAGTLPAPAAQAAACTPGETIRALSLADSFVDCDDCRNADELLGFTMNFFGTEYSDVNVFANGHIKLNNASNIYTPYSLATTNDHLIAPFFADVDLRLNGGVIYYGQTTIDSRQAYAVTYDQVGYFSRHTDKLNTFQVIIIDRSDVAVGDFDLEFNYDQILWETGDASGGTNGFGGTSAVAGFTAGDGINYFEFPGSLVNGGLLDSNPTTGPTNFATNSDTCGRHVVSVRSGVRQDPPVAFADAYTTDKGIELTVTAPAGVLANDTDPQNDTLSAALVSDVTHGSLTLNADGSFAYTPDAGFSGTDSFTYQAADAYFSSNTATVTITVVNHAPEITEGDSVAVTMSEDGAPTAFSLVLNATDQDNDTLTWSLLSAPAHGSATAAGSGNSLTPTYTPDSNFNGTDSFEVQVSDGDGGLDSITVNVTIEPVNDAPAINQGESVQVTMSEDSTPTAFSLALSASDAEGDTLTWSLLSGPTHGSAIASGTGNSLNPTYTPDPDFNGTDSFVVQVSDGNGGLDSITVEVTVEPVNDAPTFVQPSPVAVEMDEDGDPTPFSLTLDANDVDGDELTWSLAADPANGLVTFSGSGYSRAVAYTPQPHFNGSDSFQVQVEDPDGEFALLIVNVQVNPQPDDPIIQEGAAITVTMDEDGDPTAFDLTLQGMDPDGDALTWSLASGPANGNAVATGSGPVLTPDYTPAPDFNGTDSFVVQLEDATGRTAAITVTVEVQPVNDDPVIDQGTLVSVTVSEDNDPVPFELELSAQDVDGDELTWSLSASPVHGTADAAGSGDTLSPDYSPDADFYGSDSFMVEVADGFGGTDFLTVTITIEPVNDAPRITQGETITVTMSEDGDPTPFDLTLDASDIEGDPITWLLVQAPAHGQAQADGSGDNLPVLYTPADNFTGSDSFTVQAADDSGAASLIVVQVEVLPVNDIPQVDAGAAQSVFEGQLVSFAGTIQDVDGDDPQAIAWDFGDGATASGTLTPQHTYQDNGFYTVRLTVTDAGGITVYDELAVTVYNVDPLLDDMPDRQVEVNQALALAATFSDPGSGDSHTASVDWGDGTSSEAVIDSQAGTLQASHTYTVDGDYTVVVSLRDDDGGETSGHFLVEVSPVLEPTMYRIIIPIILTRP